MGCCRKLSGSAARCASVCPCERCSCICRNRPDDGGARGSIVGKCSGMSVRPPLVAWSICCSVHLAGAAGSLVSAMLLPLGAVCAVPVTGAGCVGKSIGFGSGIKFGLSHELALAACCMFTSACTEFCVAGPRSNDVSFCCRIAPAIIDATLTGCCCCLWLCGRPRWRASSITAAASGGSAW